MNKTYRDFKEGYYQGEEYTFIIESKNLIYNNIFSSICDKSKGYVINTINQFKILFIISAKSGFKT
jgi:hypothetical protein